MSTLGQAIARYERVIGSTLAQSSVKTYRSRLAFLSNAIGTQTPLSEIGLADLENITANYRKKRAANTTALFVTAIKQFFVWCVDVELLARSPAARLRSPRRQHRVPRALSEAKLRDLISHMDAGINSEDWREVRNHTLVLFLIQTGLRRAEVAMLKWSDVDLSGRVMLVTGKGEKQRRVPLYFGLVPRLERLREVQGRNWGAVFAKEDGTCMHPYTLNVIFQRWIQAELGYDITPHVLRHTFATLLIERGATLDEVRDLLGHQSIATTQVYVTTSAERLRGAIERQD